MICNRQPGAVGEEGKEHWPGDAEGAGQPCEAAGSGAGKAKRGGREGSQWSQKSKELGFPEGLCMESEGG